MWNNCKDIETMSSEEIQNLELQFRGTYTKLVRLLLGTWDDSYGWCRLGTGSYVKDVGFVWDLGQGDGPEATHYATWDEVPKPIKGLD